MTTEFAQRVQDVVRAIEPGDVVTYGEVAALAGKPGAARGVGAVLAGSGERGLPWWRVVAANGRLVPGHEREHARLLRRDGVPVDASTGRVKLATTGDSRRRRRERQRAAGIASDACERAIGTVPRSRATRNDEP